MAGKARKRETVGPGTGDVFVDLGFADAGERKLRVQLAKRVKAKILQASTSEVYGDPKLHPQTEDYWGNVNPIGTRSRYDEGKRCAETLFFDYAKA